MKVVFLNFWANYLGGAEYSLIDIITRATIDHEVILITSEDGPLIQRAKEVGCCSVVLPCRVDLSIFRRNRLLLSGILHLTSFFLFLAYCVKINKLIKTIKPDIVHSNVPKSHMLLFFIVLAGFKKRSILHIREIFPCNSFPYLLYALLFNPKRSSVIAISNAVLHSLPIKLQKKTDVIYNGITVPPVDQRRKEIFCPPRFLYLGRVVPWKGCDLLIDAFHLLYKKYGANAGTISLVGGTYYWNIAYREGLMHKISQHNLDSYISLKEYTTDVSSVFLSHTIFCLPSDKEPFGRVAAEAMAYSLPVLGFQSGGLPEVVVHNVTGFLSPTHSCDSMFQMMSECILKPDVARTMGVNGRNRCELFFNKEIQMQKIVSSITS